MPAGRPPPPLRDRSRARRGPPGARRPAPVRPTSPSASCRPSWGDYRPTIPKSGVTAPDEGPPPGVRLGPAREAACRPPAWRRARPHVAQTRLDDCAIGYRVPFPSGVPSAPAMSSRKVANMRRTIRQQRGPPCSGCAVAQTSFGKPLESSPFHCPPEGLRYRAPIVYRPSPGVAPTRLVPGNRRSSSRPGPSPLGS